MEEIVFRPQIYTFDSCQAFIDEFGLQVTDLVLTNRYIFDPYFQDFNISSKVVYQEDFGKGEPTDTMVNALMSIVKQGDYHRVIAIGGGTILDLAKILSVTTDKSLDWMYDHKDKLTRQRELLAIPTTCGTGSEVTNIAVINRTKLKTKMGLASPAMFATKAILIPELLKTLPNYVFATSSIDALVHSCESAVSPKATPFTKVFSYAAIEKIITGYKRIAKESKMVIPDLVGEFLTASTFAGLAFGTAGCGPVHAMSYPFGGGYHVAHGESNFVIFTGVFKYYLTKKQDGAINELADTLAELLECEKTEVFDKLDELLNQILPKKAMSEYGVKQAELAVFAKNVMAEQQRLLTNSFIPLEEADILRIYQNIY